MLFLHLLRFLVEQTSNGIVVASPKEYKRDMEPCVCQAKHFSVVKTDDLTWDFFDQFLTPCNPIELPFYPSKSKDQNIMRSMT